MNSPLSAAPFTVAILFEFGSLNGGEFSMLSVLDQVAGRELDLILICPDDTPLSQEFSRRGLRHIPLPERSLIESPDLHFERLADFLNALVDHSGVQLIHANSLAMSRKLGGIAASIKCPCSGHLRDILKLSQSSIRSLNQLNGLVAVSNATREYHVQQGLNPERVRTLYNGVDRSLFSNSRQPTGFLHQELKLPRNAQLAATIGQICLRKGQNELAEAAVLLRDKLPDLHFLLIGERHSRKAESLKFDAAITQAFDDAGMHSRLHRLGFRSDIPAVLNEIDLLIHPARQEPLGRVLLEAAACGVPVVATAVGGTGEIFCHGESAWLVPPDDPSALAAGIETIISDPKRATAMGQAARELIRRNFSVVQAAQRLLEFWRKSL